MKKNLSIKLTESAMMIALATILSFIKLANLPYGGSITIASMLPIVIIAIRHGAPWGIFTGIVHGTLQLILDPGPLSNFSSGLSVAAIIILDYILAFGLMGLAGLAKKAKDPCAAICIGAALAGVFRYLCHVASGATVWAGLSIPTSAALAYSFVYNATYMLPETLILIITAYFVASSLDFRANRLAPAKKNGRKISIFSVLSLASFAGALIFDIATVFAKLQNGETGEFDITGITSVNWILVLAVTAVCFALGAVMLLVAKKRK